MKAKFTIVSCIALLVAGPSALAAYTRAASAPVYIQSIYSNEAGPPFLFFTTSVNPACGGMYLYNLENSPADPEFRKIKMAIALAAKVAEKRVVLDYFVDPGISGWSACYVHGIQIVD